MSFKEKRLAALSVAAAIIISLCGCTESEGEAGGTAAEPTDTGLNPAEMFTDRDLEPGYDEGAAIPVILRDGASETSSDSVDISGDVVTIKTEGVYLLTGSLSDGRIVVDAEKSDKIQLVLNSVSVNCDTSAAIYVKQADKVFITTAQDTVNTLSNQEDFIAVDDNGIDAVIFSKDDLTLNGSGSLVINAVYGHGIVSKDDLVLTGGSYTISAADHCLSGKDSVRVADGTYQLTSGKDGIHGENIDDNSLGFIYIAGGSFEIDSGGDGMDSSYILQLDGGELDITAGGGSANAAANQNDSPFSAGNASSPQDTLSTKGLKASSLLQINGGTVTLDSADDALHSNGNLFLADGVLLLSTGDDGLHADAGVRISGGVLTVLKSYEGVEGQTIGISGGVISVRSEDDGLNAAGGKDGSGFGGGMRQDIFASDDSCSIRISGGSIDINADGDGIDSNGNLYISGGETCLSGPENGANGALDYNGEARITGGSIVAVGDSGMAQNFGSSSTQGAILVTLSTLQTGGEVLLQNESGETILSYSPEKSYNSVLVSCPMIEQGKTYTLTAGGETLSIKMETLIYGSQGGMGGFPGAMQGGQPGGNPNGTPPDGTIPDGSMPDRDFGGNPPDGDFPDRNQFGHTQPEKGEFGERSGNGGKFGSSSGNQPELPSGGRGL